jgi:serine/threonine-protein kinase
MSQQKLEQFGKYLLLEKLATGGMAEVHLAKSIGAVGVNKFVAIKRILPQHVESQDYIDMFKEEAKIAVNLNHGNVVSIYDFGVEHTQFYLVMEYVEGRNLRQIINEMKKSNVQFSIDQIVYIAKEVAAGLDHAHRCIDGNTGRPLNITHRDMSPQNIMLSFEGEVKIIDFGIAKAENQGEATKAGTLKGKFGYMSPEQADGFAIDLRTDIFSLGIVIWEMLANDRLFTSSSEAAILRKIRECQIPGIRKINPSIPPELERIVNKALAKDKSLRYQTAAALHRDLNRFLNTQYPEFSPHDFSIFVKTAFSQIFLDQKRRLVEYSRLSLQTQEDKTMITRTIDGKTEVIAQIPKKPGGSGEGSPVGLSGAESTNFTVHDYEDEPQNELSLDVGTDMKINLDTLKSGTNAGSPRVQALDRTATKTKTAATASRIRTGTLSGGTNIGPRPTSAGSLDQIMNAILPLILVCVFAYGGYYYFNTSAGQRLLKSFTSNGTSDRPATQEPSSERKNAQAQPSHSGHEDEASKAAEFMVKIDSFPSGAILYIDGQQLGPTPYMKAMEPFKEYAITLKKDDLHKRYDGTFKPTANATTQVFTLLPFPKPGAELNLNVENGSLKTIIYVNGMRIGERPPIEHFPIPAGVPIRVKAYDPYFNMSFEQTVTLEAEKQKTLHMILEVDQSKPAGH